MAETTQDLTSPAVLVFDVNETLLDIIHLAPLFDRVFGDQAVLREWFAQLVLYSQTLTLAGLYTPFGELGAGALRMVADIHAVSLAESDIAELKERLSTMPAHADAAPALARLRDAGFRLVTLTNSAGGASPTPLDTAGLSHFFERSFSVDAVKQFKPAPDTYRLVAEALAVETADLCLVACHLWDTIGAQAAGCRGAWVARSHNAILPASGVPYPDIVASGLSSLADQLVAPAGRRG